jgi:HAD superfamily hydrolase (TIGR01549 family)
MSHASTLDVSRIRAISIDLDDTLWPVWPAITRAEEVLHAWLGEHAPATARMFSDPVALRAIRMRMADERPDLAHDLSALRRESIRLCLEQAGDDPSLAHAAFDVFFAQRQRVDFYADALDALARMGARWPLVALSNGNADVHRVGIGHHFHAKIAAREFGVAKPDVRIFQGAADAAGVPMEAVLHIGDDVALDVVGALQAGMQAAWVNRGGAAWDHALRPQAEVAELGALCDLLGLPAVA